MRKTLIGIYASLCFLFTFFSYLFIDPNYIYLNKLFTGFYLTKRIEASLIYVLFILIFFLLYIYSLKLIQKHSDRKYFFIIIGIFSLFIFSYPTILSYDIFNYAATAKLTFFYRENPYMVMPNEFISDPILLFTRASNKFALYGFMWIFLTGVPFLLSFGNYILEIILFKILTFLFYSFSCLLIYKQSNKNIYKTSFFALNPLVFIETIVSGHNDIVMMFFVLLSFYLFKKNKSFLGIVFFIISFFIKFAVIFLLPIILYVLYKRRKGLELNWNRVWNYSLIGMTIIFLLSPLREELYPWYFIWVLPFIALSEKKYLKNISIVVSLGLMFSYVPYMFIGDYFKIVIMSKYMVVGAFVLGGITYEFINKLYQK